MLRLCRCLSTSSKIIEQTNSHFLPVYNKQNIVFSHGEGCWLYDVEGKKYLDLAAGVAVNSLGYNHPDWVKTINEQATKLVHVSNIFYNDPAAQLAEKLCSLSFAKSVFFCNSGTEATEGALKFARKYSKKISDDKIEYISFLGGFHGRSLGSLSVTANSKYQDPYRPLIPGVKHVKLNDLPGVTSLLSEKTSAVIVEPIQGEGGVNVATKDFLLELRHLCTKYDSLLIFDEIQCGMGRTGKLWCYEHAGVVPDMMTIAKALGNGYPIGAILVNEKVTKALQFGDHGSTFGGQPLATQLGNTVLRHIANEKFLANVHELGEYFKSKLQNMGTKLVTEVRGKGLIMGIEVDLKNAGLTDLTSIIQKLAERGLVAITAGSNVIRIVPPLIITKSQIDFAVSVFQSIFAELPTKG